MFFHSSSIIFRNVLFGEPLKAFRSKWSCDIFWSPAHMQFGELYHIDEDMSVYRAHAAGLYSTMPVLKSRIFNIEGLLRYNRWLGFRYLKQFSFALHRLTLSLLQESSAGSLPALSKPQKSRYVFISAASAWVYDLLDRYPKLDPAVLFYREPPKARAPRRTRLKSYNLL